MKEKTPSIIAGIMIMIITALSASAVYIDPEIEQEMLEEGSTKVIVVLNEDEADESPSIDSPKFEKSGKNAKRQALLEKFRERREKIREKQDKVIEKLKQGNSRISRRIRSARAVEENTVNITRKFTNMNGFSGKIGRRALQRLRNNPNVKAVYTVPVLQVSLNDSTSIIKATNMHETVLNETNLAGKYETVCVIDTGIDTDHEAFENKILDEYCYCSLNTGCCVGGATEADTAEDDHGHGSHCAGIAAGNGTQRGVAPEAGIIAIKVCNSGGSCGLDDMIAAVDWCIDNSSTYNITAISMSIGNEDEYRDWNCPDWGMEDSIDSARALDIMIAIASGNEAHDSGIAWPACIANATAVGASTKSDAMASYTNTGGGSLDLIAPGSSIISAWRTGGYLSDSGTSMAAPHVAGAYLLMSQAKRLESRSWTVDEIENAFKESAGTFIEGYPRLDIISSLNYLKYSYRINSSENSIEKSSTGKIKYSSDLNFTDVGSCIIISQNNISVNSTNGNCSRYNASAELTIENLTWAHVNILKDGQECSSAECTLLSYSGGTAVFTVPAFSSYSTNGTFGINAWDSTDSERKETGDQVIFYANFTNSTGSQINGTGAGCEIMFNLSGSWEGLADMAYNSTSGLYEYNRTFSSAGNFTFNAECNGTSQGYGLINTTDDFYIDIFPNTTAVMINSSAAENRTNESITCWASGSNEEYSTLTAYYSWYNNSVLYSSGSSSVSNGTLESISTIPSSSTKKGQQWMCVVYMADAVASETEQNTNSSITIANTAPELNHTIENQTVQENSTLIYDINCSDIDENDGVDSITYTTNDTSGFTVNSTTGLINWTPDFDDSGVHHYNATCSDGTESISRLFTINVTNLNRAASTSSVKINSSLGNNYSAENITCWVLADDPDNELLNIYFTWYNGSSVHLSSNTTASPGSYEEVSTVDSSNTSRFENWTCSVKVGDAEANETDWRNTTVYIKNSAPSFNHTIENLTVNENSTLYYDFNCTDSESDPITYYINATLFSINSTSGEIRWTPGFYDDGVYYYSVTCGDSSANRSETVMINVTNNETYHPNVTLLTPSNSGTWSSSTTVTFTFNASDDTGIEICYLIINNETVDNSTSVSNNAESTFSADLSNGDYEWSINCTDSSSENKSTASSVYSFTLSYSPPASRGGGGSGGGISGCADECAEGQRGCVFGKEAYVICGYHDNDDCLEWSTENYCDANQVCNIGYCESRLPSWYCEKWGNCIDGIKERKCMDLEGIEADKTETMECEEVIVDKTTPDTEEPAPVRKTAWQRMAEYYESVKEPLFRGIRNIAISLALTLALIGIAVGIKRAEHSAKITKQVDEYQQKVEEDFRKLLRIGKRKRGER